ncbi:MAG TPA: GAF domain-containing protein [Streptosporangiaceae bacterium]
MRIPPGARVYLTTAISLVAVALATWAGMQVGVGSAARPWWAALSVAGSVVAAGVPAYEQIRKERLRIEAEQVAFSAAVEMRVTMNDALDPIVRQLGRIATTEHRRDREALRAATIPMILDSAAHLIDAERARANWFRLEEGKPRLLVPEQYAGRADQPVTPFTEGTVEGDAALAMIRHNQHLLYADLARDAPPGWQRPINRDFRSFLAVPVVAGHTAYGMLTVDSVDVGGVDEAEVPLVRLLAGLLAGALAAGSADNGFPWIGR